MIRGLLAFIRSGELLNPMVLLGVILGFVFNFNFDFEQISEIYKNYNFYIGIFVLSGLYNYFFRQVFKDRSISLDLKTMLLNTFFTSIKFFMVNIFTMLFVYMITF